MEIIFDNEDHCDELLGDISYWCENQGIQEDMVAVDYIEDNVDGVNYYVITVNESLFSYIIYREFDITEKYGSEGWNGWLESHYHCKTV